MYVRNALCKTSLTLFSKKTREISKLKVLTTWKLNNKSFNLYIYLNGAPTSHQGPVSRKSRKLSGPEKPFVKLRPANSVKPVLSYVVKGIKIKIHAKFRASRRFRFEDTKWIM